MSVISRTAVACLFAPLFAASAHAGPMAAAAAASAVRPVVVAPLPLSAVQAPVGGALGILSAPNPGLLGRTGLAPALSPALPSLSVPAVALTPSLRVVRPGGVLPVPPGALKASPKAATVKGQLDNAAAGIGANAKTRKTAATRSIAGRLFDGAGKRAASNPVQEPQDLRPPDWSEDRRINRAIESLNGSEIGRDIYTYAYNNHGNLKILVDDDARSDYDAALRVENGKPVLYLTEKLVDNESPELVGAYLARELSKLYFESFPVSAERDYMAHSNMARAFAEMTDSGVSRFGYWWARSKDQWTGDAYAMERYYGSWKEAVADNARSGIEIQRSSFFNWLKGRDSADKDAQAGKSLRERYDRGDISYREYRQMIDYFRTFVNSEADWLAGSGRW